MNQKQKVEFDNEGSVIIGGIKINDKIFQEELSDWELRDREDLIDNLIDWISEGNNQVLAMKSDLKHLINLNDEYVWSSISTNKYVARSDNIEEWNRISKEILGLNKELKEAE